MELAKELPPVELLRESLEYRDGALYWLKKINYRSRIGFRASGKAKGGYRRVTFLGKRYPEHRLIWSIHHGYLDPALEVDHINRIRDDNRIENLRAVTHQENARNTPLRVTNRTGRSGVRFNPSCNTWTASIKSYGRFIYLGTFDTRAEAVAARHAAELVSWYSPLATTQKATSEKAA